MFYRNVVKRLLDLLLATALLVALSPVMVVVAMLIRRRLGSPVIFRQLRGGYGCRPFEIMKFRTMTDERLPDGSLAADEVRLTPFGRWLRATSIDELPGLFNVIRGEMSLVGPRPFIYDYMDRYTDEQKRRHDVRPGITGLAQVRGRNAITWEEKFALDLAYVRDCSLSLDIRLLWETAQRVFSRSGVSAEGHVTMPVFTGTAAGQTAPKVKEPPDAPLHSS